MSSIPKKVKQSQGALAEGQGGTVLANTPEHMARLHPEVVNKDNDAQTMEERYQSGMGHAAGEFLPRVNE